MSKFDFCYEYESIEVEEQSKKKKMLLLPNNVISIILYQWIGVIISFDPNISFLYQLVNITVNLLLFYMLSIYDKCIT